MIRVLKKCFTQQSNLNLKQSIKHVLANPIYFDYNELKNYKTDLSNKVDDSFGLNGLGVTVVKNIPGVKKLKDNHLVNCLKFFNSGNDIKAECRYNHDKYKADQIGLVDNPKSGKYSSDNPNDSVDSYINNYFTERYPRETSVYKEKENFGKISVWPSKMPEFKKSFNEAMESIVSPFHHMLYHMDKHLGKLIPNYNMDNFNYFSKNYSLQGMSLIYPPKNIENIAWLDWHTDICLLTLLFHPVYYDKKLNKAIYDDSGLLIKDRKGKIYRLSIEDNDIAFITGDLFFYRSAGYFLPVEHSVDIPIEVARNYYRLNHTANLEPDWNYKIRIPSGESAEQIIMRDPRKFSYACQKNFKDLMEYRDFILTLDDKNAT